MELIYANINVEYSNTSEYFKETFEKMYKTNSVCEKYLDSIIDREKIFPTGLKIGNINIAIPHTDHKYSNVEGIVLSTLKSPIIFKRMDDPDKDVSVDIIIHLFFNTGDKKVEVLQKLMALVQNQEKLKEILKCKNENEIKNIIKNLFKEKVTNE